MHGGSDINAAYLVTLLRQKYGGTAWPCTGTYQQQGTSMQRNRGYPAGALRNAGQPESTRGEASVERMQQHPPLSFREVCFQAGFAGFLLTRDADVVAELMKK